MSTNRALAIDILVFIWMMIGLIILGFMIVMFAEWYTHGASWDGVFDAIIKHVNKSLTGLPDGYLIKPRG